jgi:hypothetical protein
MISSIYIVDIGHSAVTIPMAGAIAAWFLVKREWKLALCWCTLFVFGLGVVALSKIAFLGWGLEVQSIGFKALSGHAFRATVVLPVFFFIALQDNPMHWRTVGLAFGIALSLVVSFLLVNFGFHSLSEVVTTWIFGVIIDVIFIRIVEKSPLVNSGRWAIPVSLITFIAIHGLKLSAISYRMVDIALYLSGRCYPYRW